MSLYVIATNMKKSEKWQEVKRQRKLILLYFWFSYKKVLGEEEAWSNIFRSRKEITGDWSWIFFNILVITEASFRKKFGWFDVCMVKSFCWSQPLQIGIKFRTWLTKEHRSVKIRLIWFLDNHMVKSFFVEVINHCWSFFWALEGFFYRKQSDISEYPSCRAPPRNSLW